MLSILIISLIILTFILTFYYKYKDFNSLDILDKIIYIVICFTIIWGTISLYYIFLMFYNLITNGQRPYEMKFFENTKDRIIIYIYFIISFILLIILIILTYIFIFWMLIIIFVPFIILIPIPIIPFIIPIPLKNILLEYVPPFKRLTDRGILPLMRRIVFTFFSEKGIKDKLGDVFLSSYGFLYKELKMILNDFIKLDKPQEEKISKGIQDDKYKTSTIDDNTDNEKQAKNAIEGENEILMNKLKDEFNICLRTMKGFTEYGDKTSLTNVYQDKMGEINCNFDKLKNYLKNKN